MTGARNFVFALCISLAATGVFLVLPLEGEISLLTFSWKTQYTNLNDNLRCVAIDPLDPRVIYIGTDKELLVSTDRGENWNTLHSFYDAKLTLSALDSEEAVQAILLIEEAGGVRRTAEVSGGAQAGEPAPGTEAKAVEGTNIQQLQSQLMSDQDALAAAEVHLAEVKAAYQLWVPDSLSPSTVQGIPDSSGFVEADEYAMLENWLSDRGQSVPSGGAQRKDALVEYLIAHAAAGEALKAAVQAAEAPVSPAKLKVTAIQEQLEQSKSEQQRTELSQSGPEDTTTTTTGALTGAAPVVGIRDVRGVTRVAIDPSNPDIIYVSTLDGVSKTEDRGRTWTKVYRGNNPVQATVLCVEIDSSHPETVLVGTAKGLAQSDDRGNNWRRPAGRISNEVVTAVKVHPFDSEVILAGTQGDGVFRSTDRGDTWKQVFTNPAAGANNVRAIAFAPSRPEVIFIGTENGVYQSADGGSNWETASGMGLGKVTVRDLLVKPIDNNLVYIATSDGMFGSDDGGGQWRRLTFGLSFRGCNALALDPLDLSVIWLLTDDRLFVNTVLSFFDCSQGSVGVDGNCEFSVDGTTRHTLIVDDVDEEKGTVIIEIYSEPRKIELTVGKSEEVDLDGDGRADMTVVVNDIVKGIPEFTIQAVAPAVPAVRVEEKEIVAVKPAEEINSLEDLEPYFIIEPTWVEVQQVASRWAEVHPDKIAAWRRGASLRAFLPRVKLDYTRGESFSYIDEGYSTEINADKYYTYYQTRNEEGHAEVDQVQEALYSGNVDYITYHSTIDSQYTYEHIEDYRGKEYRKFERAKHSQGKFTKKRWKMELDWYLGDFLYERQQLYISREARDLVELRQDVLEQVTMYYFDRRSTRIDMILNPPVDPYSKLEVLLRLQQLDASLDALTGGYFTRAIRERQAKYPSQPAY